MTAIGQKPSAAARRPRRVAGRVGGRLGDVVLGVGTVLALLVVVTAALGPWFPLPDPGTGQLVSRLVPPGGAHLLGTDQLGRDVTARVVAGARWSLGIGGIATVTGLVIGVVLGVVAAGASGWVRAALVRVIDIGISFPYLVVAIAVVAVVGRGFWPLALTLGLVCWPTVARVAYAETLGIREREYVAAARLIGVREAAVVRTHVLPALRPTIQVMAAFVFADMMIAESGLSFLGLGAPLGAATWGNMLADSRTHLAAAPWLMLAPAAAVIVAVLAANFIGDGLTARRNSAAARSDT